MSAAPAPGAFAGRPVGPLVTRRMDVNVTPADAFGACVERGDDLVWLDSAIGDRDRGRRSLLTLETEPALLVGAREGRARLVWPDGSASIRVDAPAFWSAADALLAAESSTAGEGLGWCGYVAYEAGHLADPGLPDTVGHSAFPVIRFDRVRAALRTEHGRTELVTTGRTGEEAEDRLLRWSRTLAHTTPLPRPEPLRRFEPPDRDRHMGNVAELREAIGAGEVYQACYTFPLRFQRPTSLAPHYRALRDRSPGDFGAYLRMGDLEAASTSPERFLRIDGRTVTCRPMKGTRPRDTDPVRDARAADELHGSVKDRAENVMIVDLMRNDIGRVCELGSVSVPELYAVERYATVYQMTSTVTGTLRDGVGPFGTLEAAFPPGSMTGAPKVAACKLLLPLEAEPRGLYSGSIGWLGYDGVSELSVVIRTLQAWGEMARWNVGGGIVWDSTPEGEFDEALAKAAALERSGLLAEDWW